MAPTRSRQIVCYILCLFTLTSLSYSSETVKITINDKEQESILELVPADDNKGGLLILPDPRSTIKEPLTLVPLRKNLKRRLWSSMTLPTFDKPAMTTSSLMEGVNYLHTKKMQPLYIMTIAQSYIQGLKYVLKHYRKKDRHISGLIMVSPFPYDPKTVKPMIEQLLKIDVPVLIVSGQQDYDTVLETGLAFKKVYDKEGSKMLRLRELLGTRYRDKLFNTYTSRSIASWLYYVQKYN